MNDNNNFSHIKFLKVPGGYDEYSAMRYLFQMGDFLNLPPKDLLNTISTIQKYLKKNHIPNKSNLKFVLRWMCRGLTLEQSLYKISVEQRTNHVKRAKRYRSSYNKKM